MFWTKKDFKITRLQYKLHIIVSDICNLFKLGCSIIESMMVSEYRGIQYKVSLA